MTAAHASVEEGLRSRVWSSVLAWALAPDNARTDFALIGVLNLAVGATLGMAPSLSSSRMLDAVMDTLPRWAWSTWFLVAAALVWGGLLLGEDEKAGRVRHLGWACVGTLGAMWMAGMLWALQGNGGNLVAVLFVAAVQAWYTLTALRLELPLLAQRLADGRG